MCWDLFRGDGKQGNAEGHKTVLISMKRRSKKIRACSTIVQPAVSVVCVCGQRHLRESEINERGN